LNAQRTHAWAHACPPVPVRIGRRWETHELPWPSGQEKKHYFSKSSKTIKNEEKNSFDKYYDSRGHAGFLFLH